MTQEATRELIENIIAKRTILTSSQGVSLRQSNRIKYNWLHSVYFDIEVSNFISEALSNSEVVKNRAWVEKLTSRLEILCKDSDYSI
jgi:hypothetical protein